MIYRLGGKSRVAEDNELPRCPGVCCPGNFLKWLCTAEMQSGAFWDTILRNQLRCVHWPRRAWMIFRYSYLYAVMITILLEGKLGIWGWGGGSSYPSNTLDRTLKCDDDENTMATATATATGTPKTETKQNLCTCITLFCKFLCRPSSTTTSNG